MKLLTTLSSARAALVLPLLWLLSGCAVYDAAFHPHRLPTPKMDATAKAKAKAAEKARHKGLSLKAPEAADATEAPATTGADGTAEPAAAADKKKTMSYSELPAGTKLKYDKQGLVKKSMLDRTTFNNRKLHHYDTRPLTPREASSENRKLRKKRPHQTRQRRFPQRKSRAPGPRPRHPTRPRPPPPKSPPKAPGPSPTPPSPCWMAANNPRRYLIPPRLCIVFYALACCCCLALPPRPR